MRTTLVAFRGCTAFAICLSDARGAHALRGEPLAAARRRAAAGDFSALCEAPPPPAADYAALQAALREDAPAGAPADAAEAAALSRFLSPPAAVAPEMSPGASWTLRGDEDNPNNMVVCISDNGLMGGAALCAQREPTALEMLQLLGDAVRMLRQRPRVIFCTALAALPRLRQLLGGAPANMMVLFYPSPSPEESHARE